MNTIQELQKGKILKKHDSNLEGIVDVEYDELEEFMSNENATTRGRRNQDISTSRDKRMDGDSQYKNESSQNRYKDENNHESSKTKRKDKSLKNENSKLLARVESLTQDNNFIRNQLDMNSKAESA